MKSLSRFLVFAVVVIIVLTISRFCVQKVAIDQVGVRTNQLRNAVEQKDLGPGFHWIIPGVHRLDLLDPTWHFLELSDKDSLKLRGADQYLTEIEITVVYRVRPGQAHRILIDIGMGDAFEDRIKNMAFKQAWDVLAELNTPEFYNAEKRAIQAEKVKTKMNDALVAAKWPLDIAAVLIRNIRFDETFEERLLKKQLLDQEKLLNVALTQYQEQLKETQLIERDTDYKVIAIGQELQREIVNLQAETKATIANIHATSRLEADTAIALADRYQREQVAKGELLKTQAQAEGDQAINKAYEGAGGQMYLVKKMIENIELGTIEINTNVTNPFDVEQLLNMLGVNYQLEERP
ncbi:SPFH domain-containing protein [Candidatus Sumerlaeota bacterium]